MDKKSFIKQAGAQNKVAIGMFRRDYAFKKMKHDMVSAPLINKKSIIIGASALLLTVVSVFVVPQILSSGTPRYKPDPAKKAMRSLNKLARALGRYRFHVGEYPTTEEGLEVLVCKPEELAKIRRLHPTWNGPYVDCIEKDPWGGEFVYEACKDSDYPILYSCGPDHEAGTSDDLWPHSALFYEQSWDISWTKFWQPEKLLASKGTNVFEKTTENDAKSKSTRDEVEGVDDASDLLITPLIVGIIAFIVSWLLLYVLFSHRR